MPPSTVRLPQATPSKDADRTPGPTIDQNDAAASHPRGSGFAWLVLPLVIGLATSAALAMRAWLWPTIPVALPLLVATIFLAGMFLWWAGRKEEGSRSNLGAALLSGTLIAVAVFGVQWSAEEQRRRIAERQGIQLTIGFQHDLTGIDLSGADLSRFYLRGKILEHANLEGTNLESATLSAANLNDANLQGADLSFAIVDKGHLESTDLTGANLTYTILTDADLRYARFGQRYVGMTLLKSRWQYTDLSHAHLDGADLRNASFSRGIKLEDADLTRADLRGADFTEARAHRIYIAGAIADSGTKWPKGVSVKSLGVVLITPHANLQGAALDSRVIPNASLEKANLREAHLQDATLKEADLRQAILIRADLRGTNLASADLEGVTLAQALMDPRTRLPKGVTFHALGAYMIRPSADLRKADLHAQDLTGQELQRAILVAANLRMTNLRSSELQSADLARANLSRANLAGAKLTSANLEGANLAGAVADTNTRWPMQFDPQLHGVYDIRHGADLRNADLHGQDLKYIDFGEVDLRGASLRGADLTGADLATANLSGAVLNRALVDSHTRWPLGFDPKGAGVIEE
jgi:uncharacterized protein YjbI with pentapeptide repeats